MGFGFGAARGLNRQHLSSAMLVLMFVILGNSRALAEDASPKGGYVPHMGEPLDYDKKFQPTEISRDWFLELNPLPLFNKTLMVETERRMSDRFTLGVDLRYRDAEVYNEGGTKGTFTYIGLAPKVRFYPLPALAGVFFGFKVLAGSASAEITSDGQSKGLDQFVVSPVAHVGYRINFLSGVTLALYIGGGLNIPALDISDDDFPSGVTSDSVTKDRWTKAADKLNKQEERFKPDFGITVGAAF